MQGRDAFNGLCLWQKYVNQKGGIYFSSQRQPIPVRLISYDDRSNLSQTQKNIHRLLKRDRVDILFGPYSSGLTKVAAPIAEEAKKILWNHGGASSSWWAYRRRQAITCKSFQPYYGDTKLDLTDW